MKYYVIEIQKMSNGTSGILTYDYDTLPEAENKYHSVLAYAATSDTLCTFVYIINNEGRYIKSDGYDRQEHEVASI